MIVHVGKIIGTTLLDLVSKFGVLFGKGSLFLQLDFVISKLA